MKISFSDNADYQTVAEVFGPLFDRQWVFRVTTDDGTTVDVQSAGIKPDDDTGEPIMVGIEWQEGPDKCGAYGPTLRIPIGAITDLFVY